MGGWVVGWVVGAVGSRRRSHCVCWAHRAGATAGGAAAAAAWRRRQRLGGAVAGRNCSAFLAGSHEPPRTRSPDSFHLLTTYCVQDAF